MSATLKSLGIDRLSVEEQVALAIEIWESLGENRPSGKLTMDQRTELHRRDAEV